MYDIVIKNCLVVDGTGEKPFTSDIALQDGKIVLIEKEISAAAKKVIDAQGLVVSPGFIDVHSHCDLVTFTENKVKFARILQGITTDLIGQCGLGPVPYIPSMQEWKDYLKAILGDAGENQWNWPRFSDFFTDLAKTKLPHNIASLVTHGAIRAQVIGLGDIKPTQDDIKRMQQIAREAMEDGAFGISFGLAYLPGVFGVKEELIALAKVVAEYDGVMMIHIRNHSRTVREAMEETLEVAEKSGVKLQVSHMRSYANRDFGVAGADLVAMVEEARAKGIDVTFDQHPYAAGSTLLSQVLPPWAKAGGGEEIVKRMQDKGILERLKKEVAAEGPDYEGWDNYVGAVGWHNILVSSVERPENKKYQGKTMDVIAEEMGLDIIDALAKLLISENAQACMVMLNMFSEEDIAYLVQHPLSQIGSDGIPTGTPHPRLFGTYPKFLGHYVRDKKLMSLEEGIKRLTGDPALRLGIKDRGFIKEGLAADLVIFDFAKIKDLEDYLNPAQKPLGINYVILNGAVAVENNEVIADNLGKVLRKRN